MQLHLERVCLMELPEVHDLFKQLSEHDKFTEWRNEHENSFLSHFFCALDEKYQAKGAWEVGFFDPDKDKITVFVTSNLAAGNGPEIKQEDEVFKKKQEVVQELNFDEVKITYRQALENFKENLNKTYPNLQLGDGFIVLQKIDDKTLWNFTFITKTLQFVNIKIDTASGEVESHQIVELMDRN